MRLLLLQGIQKHHFSGQIEKLGVETKNCDHRYFITYFVEELFDLVMKDAFEWGYGVGERVDVLTLEFDILFEGSDKFGFWFVHLNCKGSLEYKVRLFYR